MRRRAASGRLRAKASSSLPSNRMRPAAGRMQARQTAPDRGLAAAGLAHQRHAAARLDRERHVVDDGVPAPAVAVLDLEVIDLQQRLILRLHGGRRGAAVTGLGARARQLLPADAAHGVVGRRGRQLGQRLAAAVDGVTATGHEGAAARPLAHPDRHAGDAAQRARAAEVGDGGHQRPRVGVAGPLDHLVGRAALHHAAGVHDDDPVSHLRHHRQVVGDVHHRHAVVVAQAGQLGQDPVLGDHVQPGGGLVQHRHRRVADAGHRDRDPLLLAARQLVGVAPRQPRVGAQLDPLQRCPDRLQRRGAGAVRAQHVHHRVPHPQRRVEGAAGILRHVGDDLAAQVAEVAYALSEDRLAADADAAAPQLDAAARVAEQGQRGGGLAAAGLAHQPQDLAGADVEADVLDDRIAGGQAQREAFHLHNGCGGVAHITALRAVLGT